MIDSSEFKETLAEMRDLVGPVIGDVLLIAFLTALFCAAAVVGILLINMLASESFLLLLIWVVLELIILSIVIAIVDGIVKAYKQLDANSSGLAIIIISLIVILALVVFIKFNNFRRGSLYQNELIDWVSGGVLREDNRYEKIEYFLSLKTNCNYIYEGDGSTPLTKAASKRDLRCLQLLLEAKANPNLKDRYGDTALMYAYYLKDTDTVKLLKEYGAKHMKPKPETKIIRRCVYNNYPVGLRAILEDGYIISEEYDELLQAAKDYRYKEILNILLNYKQSRQHTPPLHNV